MYQDICQLFTSLLIFALQKPGDFTGEYRVYLLLASTLAKTTKIDQMI